MKWNGKQNSHAGFRCRISSSLMIKIFDPIVRFPHLSGFLSAMNGMRSGVIPYVCKIVFPRVLAP